MAVSLPSLRVIAVATHRAQVGQRPSPRHFILKGQVQVICQRFEISVGTCPISEQHKIFLERSHPGTITFLCAGAGLCWFTATRISLLESSTCPLSMNAAPPFVDRHRKSQGLAGEPASLPQLSSINNYAPSAFSLGCYTEKNRYSVQPLWFFSSDRACQPGCLGGLGIQGQSK